MRRIPKQMSRRKTTRIHQQHNEHSSKPRCIQAHTEIKHNYLTIVRSARNKASDVKCTFENERDTPNNPPHVKLDVKHMTGMALELPQHLPGIHIPHLHCLVVARSDQPFRSWIKAQRPDERLMSHKCLQASTCFRVPNFHLAIIRARDN